MATPFASYRGGYQTLPAGWLDAYLKVGQNYASAIQSAGDTIAGGIGKYYENKDIKAANRDSAQTGMSQLGQISEATGQSIDPSLTERYSNLENMSAMQSAQFNKDIQSAQQNALLMDRLRREKMAFDMQQQAAQRAQQMQGFQQERNSVLQGWGLPLPTGNGTPNPILFGR